MLLKCVSSIFIQSKSTYEAIPINARPCSGLTFTLRWGTLMILIQSPCLPHVHLLSRNCQHLKMSCRWNLSLALRVEDQGNDQSVQHNLLATKETKASYADIFGCWYSPVKTQNLTKNQNQDHAHKDSALIHVRPHALVTDDTDAISGGQASQSNGKTTCEMHETTKQTVGSLGVEILCDKDGYDERVDGDNTGHDNGNETLSINRANSQLQ